MDGLSDLQQSVDQLTELFYNSVGYLQQTAAAPPPAPPATTPTGTSPKPKSDVTPQTEEHIHTFVTQIIATTKTINSLVDSFPQPEDTEKEEIAIIEQLEAENYRLGVEILEQAASVDSKLQSVRQVLQTLAKDRTITAAPK